MKKGIITVIEITDSHVKLLQGRTVRGKQEISACDVRSIENFTEEGVERTLKEAVASRNIQPDDLFLIIPRRLAILKQMNLPSHNEAEIQKMIGLQLVTQIPYALEDITYNYHILEKDSSGYTRALVIVVHNEVSDRYLNLFDRIGIKLNKLTLSSFGLLGWIGHQEDSKKVETKGPVALVNIDMMHTEICFCHDKKILFSRSVNYGARDLNEESIGDVVRQIDLSFDAYHKENMGPKAVNIIIVSTLHEATLLKKSLEKDLDIPAKIIPFLEDVPCQKSVNPEALKGRSDISLAGCVGLLLSDMKKAVNLTPQKIYDTQKTKRRKKQWIVFAALFLTVLVSTASIFLAELYWRTERLKEVELKIAPVKSKAEKAEKRTRFVEFLNKEFRHRIFIPDVIYELTNLMPEEISFRSLSLNEEGNFTIQGYARSSASVNDFQESLVRSSVFHEVNLHFATKQKRFNMEVTDFKITTRLIQTQDLVGEE